MDGEGFEKINGVVASVAETSGSKFRVEGRPDEGPPYSGVSILISTTGLEDAREKQKELNLALEEAGLLHDEAEGESAASPALKTWTVGLPGALLYVEYVDMATEHGQQMEPTQLTS